MARYKLVGVDLGREFRTTINDNISKIDSDMTEALSSKTAADKALEKATVVEADVKTIRSESATAKLTSEQAKTVADEAKQTALSTKVELDTIVIQGDSSVEAAQARVDAKGTSHTTLKARLDAENAAVTTQLVKTAKSLDLKKANAQVPLDIPTYFPDDNHAVHPYVLDFPTKKYGYSYIMAFTPYSESRDRYENPSIVVSDDRYTWSIPNGLINPVIKQPATGYHYSDTMLLDNGTELEMWYRLTDKTGGQGSKIFMVKTTDLINWTAPQTIFDYGQFDSAYVAPTGHIENGVYKIWYRNSIGKYVLRTSSDLINWSSATELVYDYGEYSGMGYTSWHDEIKVIDGKYICVTNTLPNPSPDLFLFESVDGINFRLIKKIMEPSLSGFDSFRLYKASIVKHGVWYYIYYSAFAADNSCHIGLTKASSSLDFAGMTAADKTFYEKKRSRVGAIYGDNDIAPVRFPTGVSIIGDGSTKVVNSGVAGYNTQPIRTDTMTVFTDTKAKKGYIDVAGGYLDSDSNDSIQGVHRGKGAFYLDKPSKGLTVLADGVNRQRYARFINMIVLCNSKTHTVYEGHDFIDSIESVSFGLKINFKNLPSGYVPAASFAIGSPEGVLYEAVQINYIYIREIGPSHIILGFKAVVTNTAHIPFNLLTSGVLRLSILF